MNQNTTLYDLLNEAEELTPALPKITIPDEPVEMDHRPTSQNKPQDPISQPDRIIDVPLESLHLDPKQPRKFFPHDLRSQVAAGRISL